MSSDDMDGPLRASEFAATLNGDNPDAILRVLKLFAKTIRKERQWALSSGDVSNSSDSNDSDSDDDMSIDSDHGRDKPDDGDPSKEPPTKKYKKSEQWKVDTASYNVPFVGTAVARGEVATVEKGVWPTGLVKAYLDKSPLAVELLNQDLRAPNGQLHKSLLKKNRRKLSASICKAYCSALAELLTVAIPKAKLDECSSDSEENEKLTIDDQTTTFVQDFIKGTLPWVFELLNDETEKGRGKMGVKGGCGPSVAPALRVLQNCVLVSTSNARMVARYLDESLSSGVLRLCLRPLHIKKEFQNEDKEPPQKPARAEAIRLGTFLLKTEDAATNAYVCTSGNKERKIKPGIVYIAFREGIAATPGIQGIQDNAEDYNDAVGDMFEVTRRLLFQGATTRGNSRLLFDLVSREPLQHLTQITSHAPALTSEIGFRAVLDASDTHDYTNDEHASIAIEARRVLFLLLSHPSKSPLLLRREGNQIARSMTRLLDATTDKVELHEFILHCMKTSPFLVKELFSLLNVADPQKGFDYIGRIGLVVSILRKGPSPLDCLLSSQDPSVAAMVEDVLPILFPSKLRSQYLANAFKSGTGIVLMESLKLVISLFDRYHELLNPESVSLLAWGEDLPTVLLACLKKLLPDIYTIVSLRRRLDGTKASGAVLIEFLFQVIELYVGTFSEKSNHVALELLKLLPEDPSEFGNLLPRAQIQSLKCLQTIIQSSQSHSEQLLQSSKPLCAIMLATRNTEVHDICYDIIVKLLGPALLPRGSDDEAGRYVRHEATVWINALSPATLSLFFDLLEKSLGKKSWPHLVTIGTAWKNCQAPRRMNFSLLIAAGLLRSDDSCHFASFVGQVVARCILYLSDPLPLAAVVVCAGDKEHAIAATKDFAPLLDYAKMLIARYKENKAATPECLPSLVGAYFAEDSMFARALCSLSGADGSAATDLDFCSISAQSTVVDLVKFLNQALIVTHNDNKSTLKSYVSIICKLLPGLLLQSNAASFDTRQMAVHLLADIFAIRDKLEDESSFPGSLDSLACLAAHRSSMVEEAVYHLDLKLSSRYGRMRLLYCCSMGKCISSNSRLRALITLITQGFEASSDLALEIATSFYEITGLEEDHQFDPDVWKDLVKCWILISNQAKERSNVSVRRFKHFLTMLMNERTGENDLNVSILLSLLSNNPNSNVVDLCLDAEIDSSLSLPPEITLLTTLVRQDWNRYWPCVAKRLTDMDSEVSKLWALGCLDTVVSEYLSLSNEMLDSEDPFFDDFVPMIMKRAVAVLSKIDENTKNGSTLIFDLALKAMVKNSDNCVPLDDLASAINRAMVLSPTFQDASFVVSPTMERLCRLAAYIVLETGHGDTQLGSRLLSALLTNLPTIVKKSRFRAQCTLGLSARVSVQWLIDLIKKSGCFDSQELQKMLTPQAFQKATRLCLKHGVAVSPLTEVSSSLLLGLIGELLTWASKPGCPVPSLMPSPVEISDMLTSHSKFQQLFTEGVDATSTSHITETRVAVLKLMHKCAVLAPEKIVISSSTWTTILTPFDGGCGEFESVMRLLANSCSGSGSPFLDEFRFSGSSDVRGQDNNLSSNRWDWFLHDISQSRIRATIARFPIKEQFELSKSSANGESKDDSVDIKMTDDTFDKRYSPVFFLSLLLGTLEGCISLPKKTDMNSEGSNDQPALQDISAASVDTVHSLCNKGIIGICFMALCSMCERVRLHAAACLGIVAHVASTEKAKQVSSWRDRPQLLMVLHSVRRGLASLKESDENNSDVPRVLPVIASFLARAAFVVTRPDDPLYEAINRYFLKSEYGHGAFQDFHRLPAFMSLFCSRAKNPMQSRAERLWALKNIRDGLLDAASFRVVSSCHAPELILTSFENVRLSNASKESHGAEYCLLLETLTAMLDRGGYAAHTHLIRRCGLLAWMNSICCRELATFFPTTQTVITFFDLVKSTMSVLRQNDQLRTELTVHEVCVLIQPLLLLCLLEEDQAVVRSALDALQSIRSVLTLLQQNNEPAIDPRTVQSGASLHSTLQVLQLTEGTMMLESGLEILCALPISFVFGITGEDTTNFVLLSLKCCENHSERAEDMNRFMTLLLRRISLLLERYQGKSDSMSTSEIPKRIFSLRSHLKFTEANGVENLWRKCVELTKSVYDTDGGWRLMTDAIC